MKSDTKTRNTKKTIVRMLAAMLIGGVIGGVWFRGSCQCLSFQLQHMRSASKS